jgi:hypothetical protein
MIVLVITLQFSLASNFYPNGTLFTIQSTAAFICYTQSEQGVPATPSCAHDCHGEGEHLYEGPIAITSAMNYKAIACEWNPLWIVQPSPLVMSASYSLGSCAS